MTGAANTYTTLSMHQALFWVLSYINFCLTALEGGYYYYPHFAGEDTDTHTWEEVGSVSQPWQSSSSLLRYIAACMPRNTMHAVGWPARSDRWLPPRLTCYHPPHRSYCPGMHQAHSQVGAAETGGTSTWDLGVCFPIFTSLAPSMNSGLCSHMSALRSGLLPGLFV